MNNIWIASSYFAANRKPDDNVSVNKKSYTEDVCACECEDSIPNYIITPEDSKPGDE